MCFIALQMMDLADPVPDDVQDLLKTALPADFHRSPRLEWRSIALNGNVWQIESAPPGYLPQSADEETVLQMLTDESSPQDAPDEEVARIPSQQLPQ